MKDHLREKQCTICKVIKPLEEFYRFTNRPLGRSSACKLCLYKSRDNAEYRLRTNARRRKSFKNNRNMYNKLRTKENTPKNKSRRRLRNAVSNGTIIKPKTCSYCGKRKVLHGHHKDYNKPLDVKWLCALCHTALHRYERRKYAMPTL